MKRLWFVIVTLMVLLTAAGLPLSVSAQEGDWLPSPTGPYQIGMALYHWVDEARDETFTDDPNDKRELVVQVWYPAEVPAEAVPVTYFPYGEKEAPYFESVMGSDTGLELAQVGEELSQTPTHSYLDAPISAAQPSYPVLIYSHGLPGMPVYATAQIEELASHGYVVAAINHTYFAAWTMFPEGRVVTPAAGMSIDVGVQDQIFVLDQLALLNDPAANDRFSGRLDLDHVGTFGLSWGSWVATQACLDDPRFKAMLAQVTHGNLRSFFRKGLDLPIMSMDPGSDPYGRAYLEWGGPVYKLVVKKMVGFGFADYLLWPGFWDQMPSNERGKVEPARAAQIVNAYTLAFFDQYLKGIEQPLLAGPSADYPEVNIQTRSM
jgi:predicted dienelactone hydrolase